MHKNNIAINACKPWVCDFIHQEDFKWKFNPLTPKDFTLSKCQTILLVNLGHPGAPEESMA